MWNFETAHLSTVPLHLVFCFFSGGLALITQAERNVDFLRQLAGETISHTAGCHQSSQTRRWRRPFIKLPWKSVSKSVFFSPSRRGEAFALSRSLFGHASGEAFVHRHLILSSECNNIKNKKVFCFLFFKKVGLTASLHGPGSMGGGGLGGGV